MAYSDFETKMLDEYLDGELAPDLALRLETRLSQEPLLAQRLEKLRARHQTVRKALAEEVELIMPDSRVEYAKNRVWDNIQESLSAGTSRSWWHRGIAIPLPLLAAFGVAIIGVAGMAVTIRPDSQAQYAQRPGGAYGSQTVALPAAVGSSGYTLPMTKNGQGVTVTIQLQDLDQLLGLLESNRGTGNSNATVHLPENQLLTPVGEPLIIKASEKR